MDPRTLSTRRFCRAARVRSHHGARCQKWVDEWGDSREWGTDGRVMRSLRHVACIRYHPCESECAGTFCRKVQEWEGPFGACGRLKRTEHGPAHSHTSCCFVATRPLPQLRPRSSGLLTHEGVTTCWMRPAGDMERARMSFPRGTHPLALCEYMIGVIDGRGGGRAPSLELGQESPLTKMDSKVAKFKWLTFGSHFENHFWQWSNIQEIWRTASATHDAPNRSSRHQLN